MTIFRVKHNSNYTVISNWINADKRISFKSKGIYLYAFSRPDDWTFHLSDLINQSTEGRFAVKSGLKELEKLGYLVRDQKRENGQFALTHWTFYEVPPNVKIEEITSSTVNTSTVNTSADNSTLLITERLSTEYTTTELAVVYEYLKSLNIAEGKKLEISKHHEEITPQAGNPSTVNSTLLSTERLSTEYTTTNSVVVYECLKNLKIAERKKLEISKHHEEIVKKAVSYVTHKDFRVNKTLEAALLWSIKEKPWLDTLKPEIPAQFKAWVEEINDYLQEQSCSRRVLLCENSISYPIYHSQYEGSFSIINKDLSQIKLDGWDDIKKDVDLYFRCFKSKRCV